ncbi:MAG: carbohydrate binding domain-containing protein [Clostridia bacterium]|nr:carbohydrate binding domain-containing protein [Clostridia bacterium]
MKKIIAIMAAVLMLCAVIPMAAISVSAADSVYAENFESGDLAGWSSATSSIVPASELPVANAAAGNYAMKFVSTNYHYTNYNLAVEKNTTYRVTFSFLSGEASRPLNVRIRTFGSVDLALNQYPGSTTAWETHTLVFNSGNNRNLYFRFQAGHSTGTYYIDNLSVETFDGTITDDGLLQNGDFETGALDNWYGSVDTAVVDDPTGAGQGKVLQANEDEKVNFISQSAEVTAGDKYVLSFKVYGYASVTNSAFFLRLGSPSYTSYVLNDITHTLAGTVNVSDTWTTQIRMNMNDKVGAWQTVTVPFTALKDGSIQIAIYNYRANAGQYYFDDFVLRKSQNDGYIYNGNFETGYNKDSWTLYQQSTMDTASARSGAYGLHTLYPAGSWSGIAQQTISNLEVGKTYGVKFWYKAIQGGVNVNVQDSASTTIANLGWNNKTSWTQVSGTFVATETTATLNFSSGGTNAAEEVYIDDVIVYEVKDPSYDGYIYNGDFDCGSTTYWNNINASSYITYDPAQVHDGIFAMALYTDGGWGGVGNQVVQNLEVGNQYYISAWVRSDGAYVNGTLKDSNGTRLADISVKNNMTNWTKYDVKFTATETTATLNFNGPGNADLAGYVYVDSIKIEAVCDRDGHTPGAEADCVNDQYCTVCGDVLATAVGHSWVDATCTAPKTCSVCGETEGEALGHTPGAEADCENDQTCTVCGEVLNAALGHSYTETSRVDATCGADGSVTYTCGNCGDSYSDVLPATGEHVYFDDCSAICEVCGYEREAGHNVIHVEAKDATCTELGNIEYWYCDVCGMAWLDEACIMNTNMMAVKLPMIDHTYDNDFDADCNACGAIREVAAFPIVEFGKSISEDVNGYAVLFDANVEGLELVDGAADYTNATYEGYKLLGLGVTASNGNSETTIEGVRVYGINDETGALQFAFRIINIPESGYGTEITMVPYYTVEIDGVATTIEGEAVIGSYAEIAG